MGECPYGRHECIEAMALAAEKKGVVVDDMANKIETLFTYHDELRKSIQDNKEAVLKLASTQHSWAGKISGQIMELGDDLKKLCGDYVDVKKDYKDLKNDVDGSAWFMGPLNKAKEKLPWVVLLVLLAALLTFIVGFEVAGKVLDIIKKVTGWFK